MTEHLPECPEVYIECFGGICDCEYFHICICIALSACEERVLAASVQRAEDAAMRGLNSPNIIAAIKGDQL